LSSTNIQNVLNFEQSIPTLTETLSTLNKLEKKWKKNGNDRKMLQGKRRGLAKNANYMLNLSTETLYILNYNKV